MPADLEQFRHLPQRPDETWQGGLTPMPGLVAQPSGEPYRPYLALWVAVRAQKVHVGGLFRPEEVNLAKAVDALLDFACEDQYGGYRPGRIEVADAALAEHLGGLLRGSDVEVRRVESLAALDDVLDLLEGSMSTEAEPLPGPLDGRDVTLEALREFAEAAAEFYRAAPWQYLTDVDLIEVQRPRPGRGFRCCNVLGAAGEVFGLAFYPTARAIWELHRTGPALFGSRARQFSLWQLTFNTLDELPLPDMKFWQRHDLPVAGPRAYPLLIQFAGEGEPGRAGAKEMWFVGTVLRALAEATEAEIDSGRWHKRVPSADGPRDVTLALPDVLRPPSFRQWLDRGMLPDRRAQERMFADLDRLLRDRAPESEDEINAIMQQHFVGKPIDQLVTQPQTPAEHAQDVCYQAFDTFGRRRVLLARQALSIDPDCAEAHLILAEQSGTREAELSHGREALAAAERTLGAEALARDAGRFWGMIATRPYMRARQFVAETLLKLGQQAEAVEHFRELLRFNPNDNQGIRYRLLPLFMELNRDEEAARLLKQFDEDSATWRYSKALLAYRLGGDSPTARHELQRAFSANRHLPPLLVSNRMLPRPESYSLGSPEEAAIAAETLRPAWQSTPGAAEWLQREFDARRPPAPDAPRRNEPRPSPRRKRR